MRALSVVLMALVGCTGSINSQTGTDAPSGVDATPDHTALTRTLFIATDGVNVTSAATPTDEDAVMSKSSIVKQSASLSAFLSADPDRATKIDALVAGLRTILTPYNVNIITKRPDGGPYDMYVMTDDNSSAIGIAADFPTAGPLSCNTIPSMVAFEFKTAVDPLPDTLVANAIAHFGIAAGVPQSSIAGDCMCLDASTCTPFTGPCTIGGADTQMDPAAQCTQIGTTMDEGALFLGAFGHP